MFGLIFTGILTLLGWLPDSFVQSIIADNLPQYSHIVGILGYINYFFPIYMLADMVAFWVVAMLAVYIFYFLSSRL